MTRRFLDDIRADIDTMMADNLSGNFVLAQDRQLRKDTMDSSISDQCAIYSTAPVNNIPTSVLFSPLTDIFDASYGGDLTFLKPDFANGYIETNTLPGFSYESNAEISFTGANNTEFDFVLTVDGAQGSIVGAATGRGSNRPVSISIVDFVSSAPADSKIGIAVSSPNGNSNFSIISAVLRLDIKPTNNA